MVECEFKVCRAEHNGSDTKTVHRWFSSLSTMNRLAFMSKRGSVPGAAAITGTVRPRVFRLH